VILSDFVQQGNILLKDGKIHINLDPKVQQGYSTQYNEVELTDE
jgi:hypothetical protein